MSRRAILPSDAALAVVVACAALATFAPALAGGFVHDDHRQIEGNPLVQDLPLVARALVERRVGGRRLGVELVSAADDDLVRARSRALRSRPLRLRTPSRWRSSVPSPRRSSS